IRGWAKAPGRNVDVTKALAWRRAHASIECVSAGLTRGHGARAVDRDGGSVWAGAPLPTLQRIYLIEPSFSLAARSTWRVEGDSTSTTMTGFATSIALGASFVPQ